jgi:outer membrane protein
MTMRNLHLAALPVAAILAQTPAAAETLPEAISAALSSSPSLAAQRARLQAVRQALPIAWAEALPQISVDLSANQTERTENQLALTVREQPEYWIGSVRTSTLLWGAGRVSSSTRQARAQIASAVASYQNTAQSLILDVTRAYGGFRQAQAVAAAQQQSLENLTEQLAFVTANVDQGFLTQTDLAQARARLAQARADLAVANARLVEAAEAYQRLVGRPPQDLTVPESLTGFPSSLSEAVEVAAVENPQINTAIAEVEGADASVGIAASQGRVRVSVETNNSMFDEIRRSRVARGEQSEDSVSLRVSVPIYQGGATRARTEVQRQSREAARFELAENQRRVREQVIVAWSNLNAARARLASSQARVEAAELASRGIRREQNFGQRSTIDVLNQEQELLSARVALAGAENDAMVAERALAANLGRLAEMAQAPRPPDQALPESNDDDDDTHEDHAGLLIGQSEPNVLQLPMLGGPVVDSDGWQTDTLSVVLPSRSPSVVRAKVIDEGEDDGEYIFTADDDALAAPSVDDLLGALSPPSAAAPEAPAAVASSDTLLVSAPQARHPTLEIAGAPGEDTLGQPVAAPVPPPAEDGDELILSAPVSTAPTLDIAGAMGTDFLSLTPAPKLGPAALPAALITPDIAWLLSPIEGGPASAAFRAAALDAADTAAPGTDLLQSAPEADAPATASASASAAPGASESAVLQPAPSIEADPATDGTIAAADQLDAPTAAMASEAEKSEVANSDEPGKTFAPAGADTVGEGGVEGKDASYVSTTDKAEAQSAALPARGGFKFGMLFSRFS